MTTMLILLLLVINFAISWWNARVVGQLWYEKDLMGWFGRAVLYSALVQSVVGFSTVLAPVILLGTCATLQAMDQMTAAQSAVVIKFGLSFWYVLVIIPALGSGLVLTLHSWIEFAREKTWTNGAVAAWNTVAQISNMYHAARDMGPALETVWEGLKVVMVPSSDDNWQVAAFRLAMAAIIVALLGSILLTAWIVKRNLGTLPIPTPVQQQLNARRA